MASQMLENAFTMDTSSIKYGPGVTREVGYDMKILGATTRTCSNRSEFV